MFIEIYFISDFIVKEKEVWVILNKMENFFTNISYVFRRPKEFYNVIEYKLVRFLASKLLFYMTPLL